MEFDDEWKKKKNQSFTQDWGIPVEQFHSIPHWCLPSCTQFLLHDIHLLLHDLHHVLVLQHVWQSAALRVVLHGGAPAEHVLDVLEQPAVDVVAEVTDGAAAAVLHSSRVGRKINWEGDDLGGSSKGWRGGGISLCTGQHPSMCMLAPYSTVDSWRKRWQDSWFKG